jgi:hypothetical protein
MFYNDEEGLDGLRGKNRAQTTPDASFGPIGTCFFNINVFFIVFFYIFTTTTPSAHPTLLARKHEPRVGFPSPTINPEGQRRPTVANHGQRRPTKANEGPHHPT